MLEFFSLKIFSQNFENQAVELGVIHSFPSNSEYGAGLSCADFNQDGLDDITLPSVDSTIFFFQNTGDSFVKLDLIDREFGEVKSVCWIDYDNDFDLDLSLTVHDGSLFLFENIGDLELVDITESALLTNESCHNYGHSWVDINQDGLQDVYLNRYFFGQDCPDLGSENLLFVNNGDNTFTERASEYGIDDGDKMSFQSSFYDYDKDGLLDLHIINDRFYENSLYRNTGLGYFEDISESAGVNLIEDAMTNTIFDFNLDGFHDIYFTNTWPNGSHLLIYNPETQSYEDQFPDFGAESYLFNWGALPIDYDNDRFTDLALSSGAGCGAGCSNMLFRNNGDSFTQSPNNFNEQMSISYGVAKGDFNSDGFYDITFLNEAPANTEVYINTANQRNWLKAKFSGAINNFFGIGVQYEYYMDGVPAVNTVFAGSNYLSQDSYTHILGMSDKLFIDSLSIHWTSGLTENHYNLTPFQTYNFKEGQTFETSLNLGDTIYICPGEEIEIESSIQYFNSTWNNQETTPSLSIDTPGEYYALLEVEPGINIYSDTIVVLFKPDIELNFVSTIAPSCFDSEDGAALITHYNLAGELESSIYQDLPDGISTVQIVDSFFCPISTQIELFSPSSIYSSVEVLSQPCDSSDFGSIEINSFGGSPPFEYSIDDLNSIAVGENTIITTDNNGCEHFTDFSIDLLPLLIYELNITPQIGDEPGSLLVNTEEEIYLELYNSNNELQTESDLTPGDYYVLVTDGNGCTYHEDFTIETIESNSEIDIASDFFIYPNPTGGLIQYHELSVPCFIEFYSNEGKKVLEERMTHKENLSSDIFNLKSGMYTVKISMIDQVIYTRLIKN